MASKSADLTLYRNQHSEDDVIVALSHDCVSNGYNVKKSKKLKFGTVDLVAWNNKQVILFEVKYEGGFNDIIHGLGQLLTYREQFHTTDNRPIRCVIYSTAELEWEAYEFLKKLCTEYDVILDARLVDLVKYL